MQQMVCTVGRSGDEPIMTTYSTITWHQLEASEVAAELKTDLESGLTVAEADARAKHFGPNELPEAPPPSVWALFASQFSNLIIWVLIGAAIVSGVLKEWIDAGAILAIVVLNATLGFVQEYKAERSLAALKKLSSTSARVVREGIVRSIPARDLVPGDLIHVEAGDHVPADARLTYVAALRTQEAALTGESTPVDKRSERSTNGAAPLGDQQGMLFLGTDVAAGKGRAIVVASGLRTELGRIAKLMQAEEREPTPLQRRLEQLARLLLYLSLGIVAIVFALGLLRGEPVIMMFLTAVSLAVAAIPEGLPAIVTITLALGVTNMVRRHALIRKLPAVETLGSTTVICTDKTGTLTKNEMTVTRLYVGGEWFGVSGEGYTPTGTIVRESAVVPSPQPQSVLPSAAVPDGVVQLLTASVLCNDATLEELEGGWRIVGDPTEGALVVAAAKAALQKTALEADAPLLGEVPFDSERKLMTVVRRRAEGPTVYVKGAPDVLVQRCGTYLTAEGRVLPLDALQRTALQRANAELAHHALRVLAVGRRVLTAPPALYRAGELETDLTLLGLVAMKDPLRAEAKAAVDLCHTAGIQPVMITGDHPDTAVAIGRELGVLTTSQGAVTGAELDRLSDEELAARVESVAVYARVSAEHKMRIVRAWKSRDAVVAMTGDGVNDAPAVKAADIGIAMGRSGTDVTKEAADMVITDDNFASIAAAVEAGRGIYSNILKSVHYLLSCNISEVLVMLVATVAGLPLPLLPVQILWINLVTDGFPALALSVEPVHPDIMRRPPRRPSAPLFSSWRLIRIVGEGLIMAIITTCAFAYTLHGLHATVEEARALSFTLLVVVQLVHAMNCRSDRQSLFSLGMFSNPSLLWAAGLSLCLQIILMLTPAGQVVFEVTPLTLEEWGVIALLGVVPLVAVEVWKSAQHRDNDA